jgi:hypothetical protein
MAISSANQAPQLVLALTEPRARAEVAGDARGWNPYGVFWLCDFAGEPGAETAPFTDAAHYCPGDDDLDHPLSADELGEALDSSFRIVEDCLDRWTVDMLAEELRREDYGEDWVHTRGSVIQRVFSHDVYHCGELSQTFGMAGLPQIDLWD